ncbi:hypothetical protein AOQ84DRAFT_209034 [Glonium stellatum]|uniref:Uncharacterized protein n=1 Tax=Glonium stellatum TaxID=574774 RepID=A0A8E2F561_9PEZI|nr:hypothetical protein AOQ84DRAFT_209034 [Glonium stellatum]
MHLCSKHGRFAPHYASNSICTPFGGCSCCCTLEPRKKCSLRRTPTGSQVSAGSLEGCDRVSITLHDKYFNTLGSSYIRDILRHTGEKSSILTGTARRCCGGIDALPIRRCDHNVQLQIRIVKPCATRAMFPSA